MKKVIGFGIAILLILLFLGHQWFLRQALKEAAIKSVEYMQRGMYAEAIVELTKLIKNKPNASVLTERAICYFKKSLYAESLNDVNKAFELNQNSADELGAELYRFRGIIYLTQNNKDNALVDFNKTIDLNFAIGNSSLLVLGSNHPVSEYIAFEELERNFSTLMESAMNKVKLTNLQQRELWDKNFRDKRVLWACRVDNINDEFLVLRISASIGGVGVNIFLNPAYKDEALKLNVGQRIKVLGLLDDFGGVTAKYSIKDARINATLGKDDLWPERRDWLGDLINDGRKRMAVEDAKEKNKRKAEEGFLCDADGKCWQLIDGEVKEANSAGKK